MSISASAIEKFQLCQRQYFWSYIAGDWDNSPPGASTIAGKRAHELIENYLKNGTPIPDEKSTVELWYHAGRDKWRFGDSRPEGDGWNLAPFVFEIGQMAQQLHAAIPETEGLSEYKFKAVIEGVEFGGVIDLLSKNHITDFKTTSNLDYAKTPRKLLNDVQRLLYAAAFPDREHSRWITGSWVTGEVLVADRVNVPSDKEKFKLHVLAPAEAMLVLSSDMDPLSLPLPGKVDYTGLVPGVCTAYGKTCKYVSKCFAKKEKTMRDVLKDLAGAEDQKILYADMVPENKEVTKEPVPDQRYLINTLYVDCFPLHQLSSQMEYSSKWIDAASQEVITAQGVPSIMLIDYGKGPHLMAFELEQLLTAHGETIEHFHLETKTAEGKALLQMLSARSRQVIKGYY